MGDKDIQEIREALHDIRSELREWRAGQAEVCKAAAIQRAEHHKTLYCTGTGLAYKVQELEGKVALVWLGVVGFLGMIGKYIWDMISSRTPGG